MWAKTENRFVMAIEKVLASDVNCILCMDDNICMVILRILRKKGIPVPERIKVASLHNSNLLDEWYPPVSCVHFDVDELGKEASRILYVYLTENKRLPKSILGYELQMKASTN
jgi:DNA-binding LacI/PurR family transcriptional regulator